LVLTLSYLVGMNAFLQTRWFRNLINFSPEQLRVEYRRAYSVLPGKIRAEGLSIRGSDGSVEWILKLDTCDFHVQFLDLLHRTFHADHVRGSGLSMRLRMRLTQEEATARVMASLPPVPGFPDPPYLEIGPPTAPLTDANYNLWSIQLDDVDAQHVREIWIHTLRYAGDMRVRGRWMFRPLRWLEVGPATIDVAELDVSRGLAPPMLARMRGTVETTVHPFDVRTSDGFDILRHVSIGLLAQGLGETRELAAQIAPGLSWTFEPAEAPLELRVRIDHGQLRPGSRISVSPTPIDVHSGQRSMLAAITGELRVDEETNVPVVLVDVGASNIRTTEGEAVVAHAASASLRLKSRNVDSARPSLEGMLFWAELSGAEAPTVAFLHPLFPQGVNAASGVARLDGHLEGRLDDETARGKVEFSIRELKVSRGADRASGDVRGVLDVLSSSLRDGKFDLSGSRVDLADVVATFAGTRGRIPSIALRSEPAVLERGVPPNVNVDIDVPEVEISDLRDLNHLLPSGSSWAIRGGRARLSGRATLRLQARSVTGTGSLVTLGLAMRLGAVGVTGRLAARVAHAEWGWGSHALGLSDGALVLRDLSATTENGDASLFVAPLIVARAPTLAFDHGARAGTVSVDLPDARMGNLRAVGDLLMLHGLARIDAGTASASLRAAVNLSSLSGRGTLRLDARELRMRIGHDTYQGELDVALQGDNRGRVGETTDLSGSTVAFTRSDVSPSDAWWARASIRDAELRLVDTPSAHATVHLEAEDASPIQALLARVTPVPRWVLDAFPTSDLRVDGELLGSASSLEARSVVAESSGTSVRLEYAKHDADKEGLALVTSGSLCMGFRLAGTGQSFLLFGAESWFDRQVRLFRARASGW
jgi:hypothetical protein